MSDRVELFNTLHAKLSNPLGDYASAAAAFATDAVLDAGYRKPRVITTLEELDALPDGSVIQANNGKGAAAIREDRQWYMPNPFYKWEYDSAKVTLPAIVLFEADDEESN
jgi:hypothetical protein